MKKKKRKKIIEKYTLLNLFRYYAILYFNDFDNYFKYKRKNFNITNKNIIIFSIFILTYISSIYFLLCLAI